MNWKWLSVESIDKPSNYFGNCEGCNKSVTKMYLLRSKLTKSPFTITHMFGHKNCLENRIQESSQNMSKRTAYDILHTETTEDGEFVPVICVEGEKGYHRTNWAWGKDYDTAKDIADKKNRALGLSPKEAYEIILSTYKYRIGA